MNYLELVQRAIKESGSHLEVPDTLSGITGLQAQFKDWVDQAWQELQMERPEWDFRQDEASVTIAPLIIEDEVIVPPSDLAAEFETNWRLIALRDVFISDLNLIGVYQVNTEGGDPTLYVTSEGYYYEIAGAEPALPVDTAPERMYYVSWSSWSDFLGKTSSFRNYNKLDNRTNGKPRWFTIAPNGDMHLYPRPDAAYEIQFFAPKAVQNLEVDTDEPYLDEQYRLAIVFRALMEYALYHDDRSVFERARSKYRSYKKYLEYRYMPDMQLVTDVLYKSIY